MLFYKHWLELRWQWACLLALSLFLALITLQGTLGSLAEYEKSGEVMWPLQPYFALAETMGTEPLFLWYGIVRNVFQFLLLAACVVMGFSLQPYGRADSHSLTLPVSRQTVLWTKLLLEWLGMGAGAAVLVIAVSLLTRIPLPWDRIWLSCVAAWTAFLPLLAGIKLVTSVFEPRIALTVGAIALLPVLIVSVRILHGSQDLILDPGLVSPFALWAVLGTAVFGGMTALFLQEREY